MNLYRRIKAILLDEGETLLDDYEVCKKAATKIAGDITRAVEEAVRVTIEVTGGVAEVTKNPNSIKVEIIDHDNEKHQ